MRTCLIAALCTSLIAAAPVSDSLAVSVGAPVSVQRGSTATFPCWLNPPQNAESLEVRWYRDDFDSPVMLHRAKKFEDASQEASYVDRVSFGRKDATSGGLVAGDVSLQLLNTTLEDAGVYTCYVSSDQGYDSAGISLIVIETGTPVLLSAVWVEDNKVNVSCESRGWYPEPTLSWSDQKQVLTPKSLKYSKESTGLLSVHSWLLVPSSSEVSCSVGLTGEEPKEASVRPQLSEHGSGAEAAGWAAFAVLLIATLVGLGFLYWRAKKSKLRGDHNDGNTAEHAAVTQGLLSEEKTTKTTEAIRPTDLSTAKKYYANVSLEESVNPHLKIKFEDRILRDANLGYPDGLSVNCLTAIRGRSGFSSGKHYWEVSLWLPETGLKQSWWLGVTSATVIPPDKKFTPTSSDGYWFMFSSPPIADRFQFSSGEEPKVLLPACSGPQTVGVYLDYDSGELSFYDVERESLLGSLTAQFTDEVFPFFNPGLGDKTPMKILHHKTEQDQASETGNSVDVVNDA